LALLVVLAGLGGYIYFDLSKTPDTDTASKAEHLFPKLEASQIDELTVKSGAGEVTTLKKDGGVWKMTAPLQVPAYELDSTGIASAIAALNIDRVIDENPTDLKEYGLDAPRVTVDF